MGRASTSRTARSTGRQRDEPSTAYQPIRARLAMAMTPHAYHFQWPCPKRGSVKTAQARPRDHQAPVLNVVRSTQERAEGTVARRGGETRAPGRESALWGGGGGGGPG